MSGTSQQYCLRWNNYQNNLTNVFDQLLQSEAFVDVTLACDGQSLKCHKMVLSACSPFFQNLFFDNPCSHPIVILKDIRWEELKAVVEFMYRGEINVSQEQLAPLLKVAEVLKIRGLADVSRGSSSSDFVSTASHLHHHQQQQQSQQQQQQQQQQQHTAHGESDTEGAPTGSASRNHTPNGNGMGLGSLALAAHLTPSSLRRKRRKVSTPERTPSPADTLDDQSNQHDLDSNNGDYDHSPALSSGNCEPVGPLGGSGASNCSVNNSNTPSSASLNSMNPSLTGNGGPSQTAAAAAAAASLTSMGPAALLNLHNAAAAAAATSSVSNELDLKPGIVEMIREEERAKMLESSHGWLGPSASTLSDSYQYQIQSLWQKCWNTNQSGMVHALRFRERGPLKSWRPETMAEAIFAVLREGLSLSQAARKYDIPYPTFVLYANRVHNMLGPSADGCSGTDLIADMRPKGRGRPQRILLGSWPEDHIRGVIRAVVFRDTGGKDDVPFMYSRDSGMCVPPQPGTSHNGLDMSIHPQFSGSGSGGSNPFIAPHSSQQQSPISNPVGGASSSLGTSPSSSSNHHHSGQQHGMSSPSETGALTPAQLQLLQQHQQQQQQQQAQQQAAHGSSSHQAGGSSSASNSPLQIMTSGLSQAQSAALMSSVLQQHRHHSHSQHLSQHLSHHPHHPQQRSGSTSSSASSSSIAPLLNLKSRITESDDIVNHNNPEIIQIKAEIPFDDLDDEEDPDELSNSEEEDEIENPAVSVIASAVAAATATAVVVSPPPSVTAPSHPNSPVISPQAASTAATNGGGGGGGGGDERSSSNGRNSSTTDNSNNSGNATTPISGTVTGQPPSDGSNFILERDVNTPPSHFQSS